MTPRRYQLRKDAVSIIERGHPWIFRDQLSTAADIFRDGQWLKLVDGANKVVGHGIFEAEGAIAIRVLRVGPERPDAAWVRAQLAAAIAKRAPIIERTDAIRIVHGESDGLAAVVVDRFADTLVVASYSLGADALARHVARVLIAEAAGITAAKTDPTGGQSNAELARYYTIGPAAHVLVRAGRRRTGEVQAPRVMRGVKTPAFVPFMEDGLFFAVDLDGGHKTGTYLDLRGLRRAVATAPLTGARVLNAFAYTGMLGRCAESAGASEIVQVETSERAIAFAQAHHVTDPARHRFITADVFEWLPALDPNEQFDLVILDPPSMTSRKAQVPTVLAAYRKLYRAAARHIRPGGTIVAACCTSRIERPVFQRTIREALGEGFVLERELPPEIDHPVTFPQSDYLKISWWRRTGSDLDSASGGGPRGASPARP